MLNHIVKWDLCTWSWLHICLIQGSILVSFSLKSPSPRLVISSYFLSMQQICNNAITPYLTTEDDVFFLAEVGYSSRGYFFSHSSHSHIAWFLWSWKEFARLHLAVTRILPVAIALILQINLLKVVESTKKGTPLLSLKSSISIFTRAATTVFAYLVLSHSFNSLRAGLRDIRTWILA